MSNRYGYVEINVFLHYCALKGQQPFISIKLLEIFKCVKILDASLCFCRTHINLEVGVCTKQWWCKWNSWNLYESRHVFRVYFHTSLQNCVRVQLRNIWVCLSHLMNIRKVMSINILFLLIEILDALWTN